MIIRFHLLNSVGNALFAAKATRHFHRHAATQCVAWIYRGRHADLNRPRHPSRHLYGNEFCPLAKHDGRADSLLIGRYAQRHFV
jgi:hypothetical protein